MNTTESSFVRLSKINVNDKIEKKNGLSYLSWAWAVDQLMRSDPDASWEYGEPKLHGADTVMVYCTVTAFGKKRTAHLPVMNYKNQPIPNPTSFEVNTAMQRCLVKAIALHGLGLYIYAGEDLPSDAPKEAATNALTEMKEDAFSQLPAPRKEAIRRIQIDLEALLSEGGRDREAAQIAEALSTEEQLALSSLMGSKDRAALKQAIRELRGESRESQKVDRNTRTGAPARIPS